MHPVIDVFTVETSQSRIDLSSEPEARVFESGLHAIVDIPAKCPSRICSSLPLRVSHILIVASAAEKAFSQPRKSVAYCCCLQQLAMHRPSGENLTAATPFLCPLRFSFCLYWWYILLFPGGDLGRAECTDSSPDDVLGEDVRALPRLPR